MSGILNVMLAAAGGLRNTMVAAAFSTSDEGYSSGVAGTLTPTTDSAGRTIAGFFSDSGVQLFYELSSATNPGQSAFTTLHVQGPGGSIALTSASATYQYVGSTAQWSWSQSYTINTGDKVNFQTF